MEIFKLWLSQKLRFLGYFGAFVAGLIALFLPWYIVCIVLVVAVALDFVSFSVVARYFVDEG